MEFDGKVVQCSGNVEATCNECKHFPSSIPDNENGEITITCFGTPNFKCQGTRVTQITTSTEKITTTSKGAELDDEKIKKCSGIIMQVLSNRIYDQDNIYS